MTLPKIAVIIPAKDASFTIKKCLDSILDLDYSDYEVILINDGSKDATPKILELYKDKIKTVNTRGIGPSAARNLAAKETDAEYLAFTDSDCMVDKFWLKELTEGFKKYPEAVVYHYRPPDLKHFCRMMYRYGLAQGFLVRKYGIFRRVHFEPILLIALLGTVIYFSLSRLSFFVYCVVFLALAVVFCFFLGTFDFRKTIQLFSLFCLTVIFWNLGFLRRLFLTLKPE